VQTQGIINVKAGQNCEYVGLQESDQQLEPGESYDKGERQDTADNAQADDKASEHFQHRVAGGQIRKQSNREADWPR
jgi:hypothetical protein